jgi:hypothetical protein
MSALVSAPTWTLSWRTDPEARALADRHYNRQSVGATGFVPPGRCLVLKSADRRAFWVTSWPFAEYVKHEWAGAWVCSAFRNEAAVGVDGKRLLASAMIRDALACTRWRWPDIPRVRAEYRDWSGEIAMITFVDRTHVLPTRSPGRCYRKAGFRPVGFTKGGLVALGLPSDDVPEGTPCGGSQAGLFGPGEWEGEP